jgi:hypothetical protein
MITTTDTDRIQACIKAEWLAAVNLPDAAREPIEGACDRIAARLGWLLYGTKEEVQEFVDRCDPYFHPNKRDQ